MTNIDAMTTVELKTFVARLEKVPTMLSQARRRRFNQGLPLKGSLIDHHNNCVRLNNLRNYASASIEAREHRLTGNIQRALELEAFCEEVYAGLPPQHKW
jgi:hypothetical protein